MARRSSGTGRIRGRWLVLGGLIVLVVTAFIVIERRTKGAAEEAHIARLDAEVRDLETQRAQVQRELRVARSRERIVPAATRRLGMMEVPEVQYRLLERTPTSDVAR